MIIYGTRATHLRTEQLRNASCPHCQTQGALTASIFSRHAHVFWIPFFPAGKVGVLECQSCHKGFKPKELDDRAKMDYKNFRGTVKTPLWKYTGLGLIALLVCWGMYSNNMKEKKVAELVANPAMYDKYTYRTEANYYSTFKVVEVFGDSIYVNLNDYETDKLSGIKDIDIDKNYPSDIYVLTEAEIKAMHTAGDIKDIER